MRDRIQLERVAALIDRMIVRAQREIEKMEKGVGVDLLEELVDEWTEARDGALILARNAGERDGERSRV